MGHPLPPPSSTHVLTIDGEKIRVEYTHDYFPQSSDGKDNFHFVSPHVPAQPHPLSESGHLSQFVPHDAVEACGGPEAYATLFAEAMLRGEAKLFLATFEGECPEAEKPRHRKTPKPASLLAAEETPPAAAATGKHAARVTAERDEPPATPARPQQRTLF